MGGDPVADKSGFLCMYMSNHPDTLVSYVRYWGKVSEHVTSAKMTGIDTKGMSLTYQTKGGTATKDIRVLFDPPLLGYEEVKPRLIGMKSEAEEALGMTPAPQVTSFKVHPKMLTTTAAMLFLIWCTFAQSMTSTKYASFFAPANFILSFLPSWALLGSWSMVTFSHGLESLWTMRLCIKHRTGFVVGAQYVLATAAIGFPVVSILRQEIQDARIASIMKGQ